MRKMSKRLNLIHHHNLLPRSHHDILQEKEDQKFYERLDQMRVKAGKPSLNLDTKAAVLPLNTSNHSSRKSAPIILEEEAQQRSEIKKKEHVGTHKEESETALVAGLGKKTTSSLISTTLSTYYQNANAKKEKK